MLAIVYTFEMKIVIWNVASWVRDRFVGQCTIIDIPHHRPQP